MSTQLTQLRFIHYGQWSVAPGLPVPADGPGGAGDRPGRGRRGTLVFLADFNGDLDEYLAAFCLAIPKGMRLAFGATTGFPGCRPSRLLINYVHAWRVDEQLRYSAYPEATVKDVDDAIELGELLDRLRAADRIDDPEGFVVAARTVVASLERAPRQPKVSQLRSVWLTLRAQPTVSAFAAALPLTAEAGPGAAARLSDLAAAHPRLFDAVEGTHFARLARVSWEPGSDGHLLFSAFADGRARDYPARLVRGLGPLADDVFAGCAGYPGHADAAVTAEWLARHHLPASMFLAWRQPMSVAEVRAALDRRRRAIALVAAGDASSPADLAERLAQL